ncbi:SIS domain-containing protein [Magnetofaba australis]|nr:SIS domain-containing protein [Magnetofaba australis]
MMQPMEWFDALHGALTQSQCRIQGEPAELAAGLNTLGQLLAQTQRDGASVWWAGNGGSAALCSHLSQDLLNKLGIRSQTINDPALLTCMSNDYGYEQVYARPLSVLARPGDLALLISSSGASANILNAARWARDNGLKLATLSAFKADNPLFALPADAAFYLPCSLYGHAEVGHEALIHAVIESLWLQQKTP